MEFTPLDLSYKRIGGDNSCKVSFTLLEDGEHHDDGSYERIQQYRIDVSVGPSYALAEIRYLRAHEEYVPATGTYKETKEQVFDHGGVYYTSYYGKFTKGTLEGQESTDYDFGLTVIFRRYDDVAVTVETNANIAEGNTIPKIETHYGKRGTSTTFSLQAWPKGNAKFVEWTDGNRNNQRTVKKFFPTDGSTRTYHYTAIFVKGAKPHSERGPYKPDEPWDPDDPNSGEYGYIILKTHASPDTMGSTAPAYVVYAGPEGEVQEMEVVATPNDGADFLRWTKNGSEVSTSETYGFEDVFPAPGERKIIDLTAEFGHSNDIYVKAAVSPDDAVTFGARVSPSEETYTGEPGSSVTVTYDLDLGSEADSDGGKWSLVKWIVDGVVEEGETGTSITKTWTFTEDAQVHSVIASLVKTFEFRVKSYTSPVWSHGIWLLHDDGEGLEDVHVLLSGDENEYHFVQNVERNKFRVTADTPIDIVFSVDEGPQWGKYGMLGWYDRDGNYVHNENDSHIDGFTVDSTEDIRIVLLFMNGLILREGNKIMRTESDGENIIITAGNEVFT